MDFRSFLKTQHNLDKKFSNVKKLFYYARVHTKTTSLNYNRDRGQSRHSLLLTFMCHVLSSLIMTEKAELIIPAWLLYEEYLVASILEERDIIVECVDNLCRMIMMCSMPVIIFAQY